MACSFSAQEPSQLLSEAARSYVSISQVEQHILRGVTCGAGLPGLVSLAWAGTRTASSSRTPEGLSAFVFMWVGSLVSERGTERHVPKEITNISTRELLGFAIHQFRGRCMGGSVLFSNKNTLAQSAYCSPILASGN